MAFNFILFLLYDMRAYERGQISFYDGLGWCCRHTITVNSDDREGLHWFVCAMDCT